MHRSCAGGFANPRVGFGNFSNQGNANTDQTAAMGVMTLTGSIDYGGTRYQMRWNGRTSVTYDPGAIVECDPIGVMIPGNTLFYVNNYLTLPGSGQIPTGVFINSGNGEGIEIAASGLTDKTMSGTVTASTGTAYGPLWIRGDTADRNLCSVAALVGSWAQGIGDTSTNESTGWIARAFQGVAGICNLGVSGSQNHNWTTNIDPLYRAPLLSKIRPSHCIASPPANDFFSGGTLAQGQSATQTLWAQMRAMGMTVWAFTIPPHATSSNQFIDLAGQSVNGGGTYLTKRNSYNAWVKTMIGSGITGVIDINTVCENDPVNGDGLWVFNGSPFYATADGDHATPAIHALIAAIVPVTSFNQFV